MRYAILALAAAFSIGGCSILEDEVGRGYAQRGPMTAVTFTTADVRLITQRNHYGSPDPIVCSEPTPDVAKVLSAAAAASGSVANKGSFSAGGASAEAVAELAGRSTALLGLRDGLYRTCEAYANGVIGADVYALVLSRYGQLMTTLFLGQDVTGAAGTEAGATAQSPPINVNMPGAASLNVGPTGSSPPDPPTSVNTSPSLSAKPSATPGAPTAATTSQTAAAAASAPAGPLALTRMNEDYLNLTYSLDGFVVACINYYDPTRIHPVYYDYDKKLYVISANSWLAGICAQLLAAGKFSSLADAAGRLVAEHVLAQPVDPSVVASSSARSKSPATASTPAKKPSPAAAKAPAPAQIMLAQERLKKDGEIPTDPPNGKLDPPTLKAVEAYQTKNKDKLKETGQLDPATLRALGVP